MTSVKKIIADAMAARRALGDLEQDLQGEIDEIRFRAFRDRRRLTDKEKAQLKARRATKAEARAAYVELTFVNLQRINESEELKWLNTKLDEINTGLKDDLDRLKRLKRYGKGAANVAEAVGKVADQIAEIAL